VTQHIERKAGHSQTSSQPESEKAHRLSRIAEAAHFHFILKPLAAFQNGGRCIKQSG
jgi:hypothetical protein